MATTLPASKHVNVAHQYGCAATLTVATFVYAGIVHRAVRFWRENLAESGKVEIYTLEPYPGAPWSSSTELGWYTFAIGDFYRYARRDATSGVDALANRLIATARAQVTAVADGVSADQDARFELLELM